MMATNSVYFEIRVTLNTEIITRKPVGTNSAEAYIAFNQFLDEMRAEGYDVRKPKRGNRKNHYIASEQDGFRYDVWLVDEPTVVRQG